MRIDRQDLAAIADEYVLGLLDEAKAAQVEAELAHDAALSAAVAAARDRFLPLDTGIEPATVAPDLWDTIAKRLPDQCPHLRGYDWSPSILALGESRLVKAEASLVPTHDPCRLDDDQGLVQA